jgi:hypothetical protein
MMLDLRNFACDPVTLAFTLAVAVGILTSVHCRHGLCNGCLLENTTERLLLLPFMPSLAGLGYGDNLIQVENRLPHGDSNQSHLVRSEHRPGGSGALELALDLGHGGVRHGPRHFRAEVFVPFLKQVPVVHHLIAGRKRGKRGQILGRRHNLVVALASISAIQRATQHVAQIRLRRRLGIEHRPAPAAVRALDAKLGEHPVLAQSRPPEQGNNRGQVLGDRTQTRPLKQRGERQDTRLASIIGGTARHTFPATAADGCTCCGAGCVTILELSQRLDGTEEMLLVPRVTAQGRARVAADRVQAHRARGRRHQYRLQKKDHHANQGIASFPLPSTGRSGGGVGYRHRWRGQA